jgi:hypothetical protein
MKAETNDSIEKLEGRFLGLPQAKMPLKHLFAPGVYLREIFMPAGTFVIGHEHRTKHFNIVLTGKAVVMMDGVIQKIEAPCTFISEPGVRKVLYITEDMRWQTVHPTNETCVEKLEEELIVKSDTFLQHQLGKEISNEPELPQEVFSLLQAGQRDCYQETR